MDNYAIIHLSPREINLLREALDIEDEMNEEEEKAVEDDPYFLLAQRLANAPQVKVHAKEEGEVVGALEDMEELEKKCPICSKLLLENEEVTKHVKVVHPEVDGVVCPHCCKLLSKKCTLNRHIEQVHLGLQIFKPAKCPECGKVFSKKGHLDRHVRTIHMGMKDESEPCPHCGKIFTTKSSLEPHIEAVHKGVRRECQVCGKVLSDLWKHMRTVHGQYRRKTKIPKEEVFKSPEQEQASQIGKKSPASSPNKRKASTPLKVKLPFKMEERSPTSKMTKDDQDDDDDDEIALELKFETAQLSS